MPPASKKTRASKKVAVVVVPSEPEIVIVEPTPEPEPEPEPVALTCDEFAPQFSELALTMPQSVRKQVAARLLKKKLNPTADDLDDAAAELIQEALRHAHAVYARKRDRAAIASAAKRVMVKASKVAEKPDGPEKEVIEA